MLHLVGRLVYLHLDDTNENTVLFLQSYHSGIPAKDRNRIQDLFCSNKIKVVKLLSLSFQLLGLLGVLKMF